MQSGSQASGESSYKAAAKQLSQVRTEAPLSSSAAQQQPASKPRSPQKRSMAPTLPFTTFAPSQAPASMAAWSHLHLQQRSPHMHVSPSMGLTSMDTQRTMDVQRQVSAADIAAYSASMRAPVRTQSLPRLQQEAASTSKLHAAASERACWARHLSRRGRLSCSRCLRCRLPGVRARSRQ